MTVPSFIIVGFVWQILGRGPFCPTPHPWAVPKRTVLNRVNGSIIIGLKLEKSQTALLGSDKLYDILDLDSQNTWTTLLGFNWFYDVLELDLKSTQTSLRSSRHDVFCKKGVLRNFAKFIGKHLYQSLFFTVLGL